MASSLQRKQAKVKARKNKLKERVAKRGCLFEPVNDDLGYGAVIPTMLQEGNYTAITDELCANMVVEMQLLKDCLKDERANFVWAQYYCDTVVLGRNIVRLIEKEFAPVDSEQALMFSLTMDLNKEKLFDKAERTIIAISERCKAYVGRWQETQVLGKDNPFTFVQHGDVDMPMLLDEVFEAFFDVLKMVDFGTYQKARRLTRNDLANSNLRLPKHFTMGLSYPMTLKTHQGLRNLVNRYRVTMLTTESYTPNPL